MISLFPYSRPPKQWEEKIPCSCRIVLPLLASYIYIYIYNFITVHVSLFDIPYYFWWLEAISSALWVFSFAISFSYFCKAARKSADSSRSLNPSPILASRSVFSSLTRMTKYLVESVTASTCCSTVSPSTVTSIVQRANNLLFPLSPSCWYVKISNKVVPRRSILREQHCKGFVRGHPAALYIDCWGHNSSRE